MRRRLVTAALGLAALVGLALISDRGPTPMLGVYTWGAEVNTWRSCGGTETRWVQARPRIRDQLAEAHRRLTTRPYQGILVRAYLRHSGSTPDGFALDYDGLIRIDSVLSIGHAVPASCLDSTWALPGRRSSFLPR
jgi:hypothetical protein